MLTMRQPMYDAFIERATDAQIWGIAVAADG
jgi:hypothetical protein